MVFDRGREIVNEFLKSSSIVDAESNARGAAEDVGLGRIGSVTPSAGVLSDCMAFAMTSALLLGCLWWVVVDLRKSQRIKMKTHWR